LKKNKSRHRKTFKPRRKQRSPQSVLENGSRKAFFAQIPDEWIHRNIENDMGVDAQIEVCENGESLALLFNVQIKSSGNRKNRKKARIEVSELFYLQSLDMPAMIVHWSEPFNEVYAMWLWEALARMGDDYGETVTINFDDHHRLSSKLNSAHISTLYSARKLRDDPKSLIALDVDFTLMTDLDRVLLIDFICETRKSGLFTEYTKGRDFVPLRLSTKKGGYEVTLDNVISHSFHSSDRIGGVADEMLFTMASIFATLGLQNHASVISQYILSRAIYTQNPVMALQAIYNLKTHPKLASQLALQLEVHHSYDDMFIPLLMHAQDYWVSQASIEPLLHFLDAAAASKKFSTRLENYIRYRMANLHAFHGNHVKALRLYREVVGADTMYLAPGYMSDIVMTCIGAGRYRLALKLTDLYLQSPHYKHYRALRAELLFLCGRNLEAAVEFEREGSWMRDARCAEMRLKAQLARWLSSHSLLADFRAMRRDKWRDIIGAAYQKPLIPFAQGTTTSCVGRGRQLPGRKALGLARISSIVRAGCSCHDSGGDVTASPVSGNY